MFERSDHIYDKYLFSAITEFYNEKRSKQVAAILATMNI